ncbi:MAG: hypothetical protein AAB344_02765 [Bacteroidota bacterium]
MARVVIALVMTLVLLFISRHTTYALPSQDVIAEKHNDTCFLVKAGSASALGSNFKNKLEQAISNDPVKVRALSQALSMACRSDVIDLSQTLKYRRLKELLRIAREEYESKGAISTETLRSLKQEVGVTREDVNNGRGKLIGWQLVIDKKVKDEMRIRTAASLASYGNLFIEAFHQLSRLADVQPERQVLLDAIERTARAILDNPDENEDGRFGWGRLWFKGKDGLLLHTSVPAQNMYFGGYTYFPRANSLGQATCEMNLPLKEEAFDHAQNTIFLLEAFLVMHDRPLAERILLTVGKSFDDTFDEGGAHKQLGDQGWYYWKSLGKQRHMNQVECDVGREVKNTNLRMGLALLAFSEILLHNREELEKDQRLGFSAEKYLNRAMQVIRTNNYEIFEKSNFGYQGANSRDVELLQEPDKKLLVYDRTQITVEFHEDAIGDLKDVIIAGNEVLGKDSPPSVIICGGGLSEQVGDRGVAKSCWDHLALEAEDYFRIARFTNAWSGNGRVKLRECLEAIARILSAAKILYDGRESRYAHNFQQTAQGPVLNEMVNLAIYGFSCMARHLAHEQTALTELPMAHQRVLGNLAEVCEAMPTITEKTGVTWRNGQRFYQLYLSADRFSIPSDDWLLSKKM